MTADTSFHCLSLFLSTYYMIIQMNVIHLTREVHYSRLNTLRVHRVHLKMHPRTIVFSLI